MFKKVHSGAKQSRPNKNRSFKPSYKKKVFRKARKELNYLNSTVQSSSTGGDTLIFDNVASRAYNATSTVANANLQHFTWIAQGDDNFNRNGRKVLLKSLQIKWSLNIIDSTQAALNTRKLRVIIFQDREHSRTPGTYVMGTAAATDDGMLSNTGATLTTADFPNVDNAKRFRILRDFSWNLGDYANNQQHTSEAPNNQTFTGDWYIPINAVAEWDQYSATIPSKNGIYMMGIADAAALSSTYCNLAFKSRIRFYEM